MTKQRLRYQPAPWLFLFTTATVIGAGLADGPEAVAGVVVSGGGLYLVQEGPASPTAGSPSPVNLATGATPIAHGELAGFGHLTVKLNDGLYGNAYSWIGDGPVPAAGPYAGVTLGAAPVPGIQSIAFSRSNVLAGDPCGGGVCSDRSLGLYTLQYTQLPNPTGAEGVTGNPTTGWAQIATLDYQSAGGLFFSNPHQRHRFNFDPVDATGLRLIVPTSGLSGGTAIDEIEVYNSKFSTPLAPTASLIIDESTNASPLPFSGIPIPSEPAPGNGQYGHLNGPGEFFFQPVIEGTNVTVEASWGVSINHSQDVDFFFDPDGAGPLPEIALLQDVNQTLLADQSTVPAAVEWSGFLTIAESLNLTPDSIFRVTGTNVPGGSAPQALSSAAWRFTSVPEPSSVLLWSLLGTVGIGLWLRRNRHA